MKVSKDGGLVPGKKKKQTHELRATVGMGEGGVSAEDFSVLVKEFK